MSTMEYAGWWWIPQNPDDSVPGTLKFSQEEGLRLSLQGSLGDTQVMGGDVGQGKSLSLILGVVPNLRVTLIAASPTRRQLHSPGFDTAEYRVGIAYLGEHIERPEDLRFSKLKLQLTHLGDWIAEGKVYWRVPRPDDSTKRYEFGYEHQNPEPEPIEGGTVAIDYQAHMQQTTLSAELRVSPVIRFELQEPLDIDGWHRHYLRPVANLLSLATGRAVYLSEVKVFPEGSDKRDGVQVVAQPFVTERLDKSVLTSDGMLFSRRDLNITFGELMQRWLTIHRELEPILNLYFSIGRSPAMYLEHRFLSLFQALEGYHRRRFPEKKQRERLCKLIDTTGEIFSPWAPNPAKKSDVVTKIVQTRNGLTHQTPGQVESSLDVDTLFLLTEALSILMQALLLVELGFEFEKRVELFRRYQPYIFAARRASGDSLG
jgi:hypothetical protein